MRCFKNAFFPLLIMGFVTRHSSFAVNRASRSLAGGPRGQSYLPPQATKGGDLISELEYRLQHDSRRGSPNSKRLARILPQIIQQAQFLDA